MPLSKEHTDSIISIHLKRLVHASKQIKLMWRWMGQLSPSHTRLSKDTTDEIISILWNSPFTAHMGSIQSLSDGSRYGPHGAIPFSMMPHQHLEESQKVLLGPFSFPSHRTTGAHYRHSASVFFFIDSWFIDSRQWTVLVFLYCNSTLRGDEIYR